MPKFLTQEEFVAKAVTKHGDKYDYSNTTFTATKDDITYVCNICKSEVTQKAKGHLEGYGCSKCGQENRKGKLRLKYAQLVSLANSFHGDKYRYSKNDETEFNSRTSKLSHIDIIVTCPIHGDFIVNAERHIKPDRLQGCQKCRVDALIRDGRMPGGYCETLFEEQEYLAQKPGILYYLKIGNLYKIGITTNLANRVGSLRSKSGESVEVLYTFDTILGTAFKLEQAVLQSNSAIRTVTTWSTELFTACVIDDVIRKIENES